MQKPIGIRVICFFMIVLLSCKNEGSIQTYFVEHQELPNFTAIDLSPKMVDISKMELTQEQKEAYHSLKKINFLGYRVNEDNLEAYNNELGQVEKIFKSDKYDALMEFKTDGMKFKINTESENNEIDELLVLASTDDKGFGVFRVLGDNMKPEKMVKLIDDMQNASIDENQFKGIIDFFK